MSDWAKELLADVAREQLEQLPNFDRHLAVLERRLLGLLEAGEAMRDGVIGGSGGLKRIQLAGAYDAAKAVASQTKRRNENG